MTTKLIRPLLAGAALCALCTPAYAQSTPNASADAEQATDTIHVLGHRLVLEAARENLDLRAGATSLIDAEAYQATRAATLSDMLDFAPGVIAQTRHGEDTRLSIRGSGIQRGFLLRGVSLFENGVPLNLADGGGDFQAIDPLSVQYIEIWRGGNALEYGASTLGGAINFVSPTALSSSPLSLRVDAGSFGQRRGHVQLAGARDHLDGLLSATVSQSDGYRTQSGSQSTRISANTGYKWTDTLETRFYFNYVDSDMDMPGALTLAQFEADPEQAAPQYAELGASNNYTQSRGAGSLIWSPTDALQLKATVFYSERDRYHPMVRGILDQNARNGGFDLRGVYDGSQSGLIRRIVFGASAAQYLGEEDRYTNVGGAPGVYRGRTDLDGRSYVLFGEYSHGLTEALTLQLGAQYARAERELENIATPSGSFDESYDGFSPKVGLLYRPTDMDQLYANITRSFEPAPFGEARVLPQLPMPDPQTATTIEVGWRRRSETLNLEATAYYSAVEDEFLALVDEVGTALGTTNADDTIHMGVELGATVVLSEDAQLKLAYQWTDFRFDDDVAFGDNHLAGLSPHTLNARLDWRIVAGLTISPGLEWRGGKTWIDHANTVSDDGYVLVNLGLSGALAEHVDWHLDARNLTDEDYVSSTLVRDNLNGADSSSYFPGDPASVYVGLTFTY